MGAESVSLKVNEKNLIRNLKYAFTNRATVIGELMQNARRAKATKIEFMLNGDELTVVDNGIGIANMQDLLTIGESGWDAETIETERAFGMGWISCLFSAKHVVVESRGKRIAFDTDQAIGFNHIRVEDAAEKTLAGTRLVLKGFDFKEKLLPVLKKKSEGFPIEVFGDGENIERKFSKEALNGVFTSVGYVAIRGIHFDQSSPISTHPETLCFLQGLPICRHYPSAGFGKFSGADVIVHLDSRRFSGRMPDREALVDEKDVIKEVDSTVMTIIRGFLEEQSKTMPPSAWIDRYWDILEFADCAYMANSIPFLPIRTLEFVSDATVCCNSDFNSGLDLVPEKHLVGVKIENGCIPETDIASGRVTIGSFPVNDNDNCYSIAYQFAKNAGVLRIGRRNPSHWVNKYVLEMDANKDRPDESDGDANDLVVSYEVTPVNKAAEGYFSGDWDQCSGDVVVADGFVIALQHNGVDVRSAVASSSFALSLETEGGWEMKHVIYAIKDEYCGYVASHLCDYISDDRYCDTDAEADADNLNRYVSSISGAAPADTLMSLIQKIQWDIRHVPSIYNQSFTLVINEKGDVSVKPA